MQWCARCPQRITCRELCEEVEEQLNISKPWNYWERFLSEVDTDTVSIERSDLSNFFLPEKIHQSRKLKEIAERILKPRQYQIFLLTIEGKEIPEIALELGVSRQTIRAAIYGSSKNRGGIIRKIKKYVAAGKAIK